MPRAARRRIDHRPNYIWTLIAFLLIAAVLPFHLANFGTAHARLDTIVGDGSGLADLSAATLGIGSLITLLGAASGTQRFRPHADIRDCYHIQSWGIIPVIVAAAIFDYGIIITREDWQVAILVTCLIIGLIWNARDFRIEANRLTEELARRVGALGPDVEGAQ